MKVSEKSNLKRRELYKLAGSALVVIAAGMAYKGTKSDQRLALVLALGGAGAFYYGKKKGATA